MGSKISGKQLRRRVRSSMNCAVGNAVQPLEKRVMYAAFTPGDLLIYQVGATGSANALTSASAPVFLAEYNTSGGLVQTIALPTATSGSNNPLTASGTGTSEGELNLSQNGANLLLTGYDALPGVGVISSTNSSGMALANTSGTVKTATNASPIVVTITGSLTGLANGFPVTIAGVGGNTNADGNYYANILSATTFALYNNSGLTVATGGNAANTSTGTWADTTYVAYTTGTTTTTYTDAPREVGIVGPSGTVNSSTTLGAQYSGGSIYGATSVDGSSSGSNNIYTAGSKGIFNTSVGSSANASGISVQSTYNVEINQGQLYATPTNNSLGVVTVGTNLPTSSGQTLSNLTTFSGTSGAGVGYSREFAFATLNGGSAPDTLYVADAYNDGIDKLSYVSGSWHLNGEIGAYSAQSPTLPGVTGLVAEPTAAGEKLFFTVANTTTGALYTVTDPYGYNSVGPNPNASGGLFSSTPSLTLLLSQPANTSFRGLAFVPQSTLTVQTQPPSLVSAVAGTNQTIFASANPGTNESVQWQYNTGSGFVNVPNGANYSGGTTDTLTIINPTTAETGYQYQAVFTSAAGTATTTSATLSVSVAPIVNFNSPSYTVLENQVGGVVQITVDGTSQTSSSFSVQYNTSNGTAVAGTTSTSNYQSASGTLSFPGNTTTMDTFNVSINAAVPQGGNKTFYINLYGGTGGTVISSPATIAVTIVDTQETFNFTNATYSVNDTDSTGEISVIRTGYTADASTTGSVPVSFSGGYPTEYANFNSGQSVAVVSFPITSTGANQTLTATLGTPTGFTGLPTIGALATATETIIDTTGYTNNLNSSAGTVYDIETSGPYSQSTAPVVGDVATGATGSFLYLAYELLAFSPTTSPGLYPVAGTTVNANGINNLTLQLMNNASSGNYAGHVGNFNVYFINDATTANSALTYQGATGVTASQFNSSIGAPILLGTYSFDNPNPGTFDSYTLGISNTGIGSTVESQLVSDLNGGTGFRIAVTPVATGVGAIAVDFDGYSAPNTPVLSLSATETVASTPEYFAFNSPTYTVNETGGVATIQLTRTGTNLHDTATVNYTTANLTALNGTNYTAVSGTATFAANSSSAYFNVPIAAITPQGGDKQVALTISSPATGFANLSSGGTSATLGSQTTAVLVISDTTNTYSQTLYNYAADVADVQTTGTYSPNSSADSTVFAPDGTNATYPAYAVADFNNGTYGPATDPNADGTLYFEPTNPVIAIDSITLDVFNIGGGTSGPVNVYLVPDATSDIAAGSTIHEFNTNLAPEGLDTSALGGSDTETFGTPMLLGVINWNAATPASTSGSTLVPLMLTGYNQTTENVLISDLNHQTQFRIVAAPETASVYAHWGGVNYSGGSNSTYEAPIISFNVSEGTTVPTWLAPGSQATYTNTSAGNTLVITGAATIICDPGQDEPLVTFTGSGDVLTIDTPPGSAIHLGGLALTGGAVANVIAPASDHDDLVISSAGGLSIDGTSQLNLGSNDLIVQGGSLSSVTGYLAAGYNNGKWNGLGGITSSAAASNTTHLSSLGIIPNTLPQFTTFDNVSVGTTDILVKYTYVGDTDLSGRVDGTDYSRLVNGALNHLTGWYNGDLNYDGVINGSDYTLMDNAYNTQGAAVAPSAEIDAKVGAVEPTAVPLASVATDSLFSRKKVKHEIIFDDLVVS